MNLRLEDLGSREPFAGDRQRLIEMLKAGTSLELLLTEIVELVERQCPGMLCSVLLVEPDGKHFRIGAAPNLPPAYNALFQDVVIGEGVGSCGTAAYRKELVIVSDIETDPLWTSYKEFALPHGLRACWSTPIWNGPQVVGTFACYYKVPRSPESDDLRVIEAAAGLASEVIRDFRSRTLSHQPQGRTVLVVEDDDEFREVVCEFLKIDGHQTLDAASSEIALSIWDEHSHGIDLVITDVEMPGMNGIELASTIEHKRPGTKILFMSGNRGVVSGSMFLPKPFSIADLRRQLSLIFK